MDAVSDDTYMPLGKATLIILAVGLSILGTLFVYREKPEFLRKRPPELIGRDIAGLTKAAAQNPDDPQVFVELGWAYFMADRFDEAENAYRVALDVEPSYVPALVNLGILLAERGYDNEAERFFRKVVKINPDYELARFNLGVIAIKKKDFKAAVSELKSVIKINPTSGDAWYYLGTTYERQGNYRSAKHAFLKTLIYLPDHLEAKRAVERIKGFR